MRGLVLAIQNAFGDCKRLPTSECARKTSFEVINDRTFCIFDDRSSEQPVKIVREREAHQLLVQNRRKEDNEVCLIKSDKCLFMDDHKKCDCILVNNHKCFFVEISEAKNKGAKRKDAAGQLLYTIELVKQFGIDLERFESQAVICFKAGKTRPTQSSLNSMRATFLSKHKIDLVEGNEISF